jgi:hypothetical protein
MRARVWAERRLPQRRAAGVRDAVYRFVQAGNKRVGRLVVVRSESLPQAAGSAAFARERGVSIRDVGIAAQGHGDRRDAYAGSGTLTVSLKRRAERHARPERTYAWQEWRLPAMRPSEAAQPLPRGQVDERVSVHAQISPAEVSAASAKTRFLSAALHTFRNVTRRLRGGVANWWGSPPALKNLRGETYRRALLGGSRASRRAQGRHPSRHMPFGADDGSRSRPMRCVREGSRLLGGGRRPGSPPHGSAARDRPSASLRRPRVRSCRYAGDPASSGYYPGARPTSSLRSGPDE